jgi:hypothetical protein
MKCDLTTSEDLVTKAPWRKCDESAVAYWVRLDRKVPVCVEHRDKLKAMRLHVEDF